MASVFKLGRDKKKKHATWFIGFHDHEGKHRTTKGCSDKGLTEKKAAQIETLVEKIKQGMARPDELNALLRKKPTKSVAEHIQDFGVSLRSKGNTEKHVKLVLGRVNRVITGCRITTLGEINKDRVETYLQRLRTEERLGPRTYNHYLQALISF